MSDTYNTKNFAAHGGGEWVIGGKLTVLEGATVTGLADAAQLVPATAGTLGGVIAPAKAVTDTVPVAVDTTGALFAPTYPDAYVLPAAEAEAIGGVKLAANQMDSTASTIAGLNVEFNALLAKLKAAGVMAADA